MVDLDQNILHELLEYDPLTGIFTWRNRKAKWFNNSSVLSQGHLASIWNTRYAGKRACAYICTRGYRDITVFDKTYRAHRLAWVYMTGAIPEQIDHINGDPADNRFANLRSVAHTENQRNMKRCKRNTSGTTGVSEYHGKWRVRISIEGKEKNIGHFESKHEAIIARKAAERALGYHENHGRE